MGTRVDIGRTERLAPVDSFMSPELYSSPEVHTLDMRAILPGSWILVADLDDLAEPDSYTTEQIGDEPVLVVRDHAGDLRAYSNVCPHRGAVLRDGAGQCGRFIECPYHGWTFGLDGKLKGVPYQHGFEQPVDKERLGLHPVAVDIWERFVFVNVSGDAPPLHEYLEPIPSLLAGHHVRDLSPAVSCVHHVDANWKVFVDNGACDYHVPVVHRRLMPMMEQPVTWREDISGRFASVLRTPLNELGREASPPSPDLQGEAADITYAFGLFPNVLLIAFRTGDLHVVSWWPESVGRTEVRARAYVRDQRDEDDMRYGREALEMLQLEDIAVCRLVERGLRSSNYTPGPRHRLEERVHGFQREYLAALSRAAADERPLHPHDR